MPRMSATVPPEKPGTTSTAPMAMPLMYSRNAFFICHPCDSGQRSAEQWHETHRVEHLADEALLLPGDQHQLLVPAAGAHRNHHAPTWRQLLQQRLGDLGGRRGD